MKNTVLVGILGAALCACLVASSFAGGAAQVYLDAGEKISELQITTINGLPTTDFGDASDQNAVNGNDIFTEFSAEELAVGYKPPTVRGGKTIIDVPVINQFPELPTGCEITSIAEVLNFLGFGVDKVYLQENFLEDSYEFRLDELTGVRYGPDPREFFVGNPKDTGFGCFAPVVVKTMDKFFTSVDSKNVGVELFNSNRATLQKLLDNGIPVIVWASRNMKPFKYTANNEWIIEGTNETFRWPGNAHVLVLVGYDDGGYYFADPDDRTDVAYYQGSAFLTRWRQFGSQAVIVKQG